MQSPSRKAKLATHFLKNNYNKKKKSQNNQNTRN